MFLYISTVPELEIMTVIHPTSTTKIHYSKCAAPLKRPFLLAGELVSPAAEVYRYEKWEWFTITGTEFGNCTKLNVINHLLFDMNNYQTHKTRKKNK